MGCRNDKARGGSDDKGFAKANQIYFISNHNERTGMVSNSLLFSSLQEIYQNFPITGTFDSSYLIDDREMLESFKEQRLAFEIDISNLHELRT